MLSEDDYEDEGLEVEEEEEEAVLRGGGEVEEVLFDAVDGGVRRFFAREKPWGCCCPRRICLAFLYVGAPV